MVGDRAPAMHRLHHSSERLLTDSNDGTILTVWDRMFGSLRRAQRSPELGIEGETDASPKGVGRLMVYPVHTPARRRRTA